MLHIHQNIDQLISATADFFVGQSSLSIAEQGRFTVALSGGSSPKKLFEKLASTEYSNRVDWKNVFFFFGDERFVPHTDSQSNFRMAKETLFDPLKISNDQVFPVDTSLSPADAAVAYEDALLKHFNDQPQFDLILLGLGDDAHTASLFPGTSVLQEEDALIKEVFVGKVKQYRITFTAPLINEAKVIAFLTYGAGKADAVAHIHNGQFDPEQFPAQLVKPSKGIVHWFIDAEAASKLK